MNIQYVWVFYDIIDCPFIDYTGTHGTTWPSPPHGRNPWGFPIFPRNSDLQDSSPYGDTAAASNGLDGMGNSCSAHWPAGSGSPGDTAAASKVTSATRAAVEPTSFWRDLPTAATYKRIPHLPTDHCCATSHTVNIWLYKNNTAIKAISLKIFRVIKEWSRPSSCRM